MAALIGQKPERPGHRVEIDSIDDLATAALLINQAGGDQGTQMVRKGREWQAGVKGNVADDQTVIACPDQEAEDVQSGRVAKRGQSASGVFCAWISFQHERKHNRISGYVNLFR